LRLIIPDVEIATGSLKVDGGIFGSIEKPNVDISVRDAPDRDTNTPASLGLNGFRPSFQNIKLDARIGTNGITLKALRATKGNGVISAVGYLARPDSGEETDITVNMDNASFLYPFPIIKYFDSTIDGQIKITGSERPWTASGRINIVKARSNRDIDLREAIVESIRSQSTADSTSSIIPLINMDISISADKSISFSSKAGQATLSSDLRVSGSNIMPSIIGLVDVSKGRFFYKREFEIKRGLINFDDPIKVDPALDISASSDVSSYKVGINISGRASSPIIDFTVEPPTRPDGTPLSKIDIIGLLNRGSLPDSSSGIGTAESTAASEALNIAAGQVEDTVQKIFDLSGQSVIRQVYIDTYADPEGMPIVRFNLPLNITDDFDVILKVDQSTVKVSSEYSLHDSISLTGGIESSNEQTGTNSKTSGSPTDTGVDLKFKFAFP
jgi:translocation and assembly module TamB